MTKRETISIIHESIDSGEALRIVNSVAGSNAARIERKVFYPYFWFSAACSAPTPFGSKAISAVCLVDACNGIGATSDPVIARDTSVPADALLIPKTDEGEAQRAAHRFLSHQLGRRLRTIGNFAVELEGHGLIHKAFWLIRCGGTVVMVDSLSGCLHSLGERAA
jgi:hypothetical protein